MSKELYNYIQLYLENSSVVGIQLVSLSWSTEKWLNMFNKIFHTKFLSWRLFMSILYIKGVRYLHERSLFLKVIFFQISERAQTTILFIVLALGNLELTYLSGFLLPTK